MRNGVTGNTSGFEPEDEGSSPSPAANLFQAQRFGNWAGYCAALWALIFAVFHVIWATGWYVGLDPEWARIAFSQTPFLVWDLLVAGICAFAVPVALALAMPWGRRLPRRLVGLFAWGGTGLLVLPSVASVVQTVYRVWSGQVGFGSVRLLNLWFYLGATLFSLATWRFWRRQAPTSDVA